MLRNLWIEGEAQRPERLAWLQSQIRAARVVDVHLKNWNGASHVANRGTFTPQIADNRAWISAAEHEVQQLSRPYTYLEPNRTEHAANLMSLDHEGYIT